MRSTTPRRRAISLVEVLTAIGILAVGLVPIFQIYSSSRVSIGISQDMLQLQEAALCQLAVGRSLVRTGRMRSSDEDLVGTEVIDGVRVTLEITPALSPEQRYLRLEVRAETDDRYYEIHQVVSDPYATFLGAAIAPAGGGGG